ncbi:short-chain dehydrogenase [Sphingopyxis lindanitolerans]|uniref:Short-chain dehydrogenase n=1 Tax=Sphingopyxis lindanitolerans TaxID=2054227 RepID=A0A2S8B1R1_9SPHN|nr:SDR family oxidoreductase [Sphingopyxis lindanitolerans]PQM26297.1 short-chain dehydrogenase [Sphingopyxis lindanitolerans]
MTGLRLAEKVAVITGGASGIGLATARRFLDEGAKVLIGDYNEASIDTALQALAAGDDVAALRVDVAQESDVARLMQTAVDRWGRLDIAFNNAGITGALGPIMEIEADHWDASFAVMARGVFLGTKHAARIMAPQGGGAIVNTASIAGLAGGVIPTVYSATKAAVVSLTRNAANELAQYRIRVNAVCPGIIFTPLMHSGREDEALATARQVQPWPDAGTPEHVASAVLYLASDEAAFVTGEAHVVDGGYLANGLLRVHPLPGGKANPDYAGMHYGLTGQPREIRRLPRSTEAAQ